MELLRLASKVLEKKNTGNKRSGGEGYLKTLNYLVINVKDRCTIDVQPEYVYTTIV